MSARPPLAASPSRRRPGLAARLDRLSEGRFALIVAAPGLLLVALLVIPPIIAAIGFSLFRVELASDSYNPFVALRNFVVRLPADSEFLGTIPVTIVFATLATAFALPIALGTALFINGRQRFRGLLMLALILPWAVAPIADGILWRLLFEPDVGIVAKLFAFLRLPTIFIGTVPGALLVTLIAVAWRAIPLLGVLFIGALRQVPPDLARAARLDGASSSQTFRHVTLPAIAPAVIAGTLLEVILTLQVFDVQFAVSSDRPPIGATLTALQIYHTIINKISLGYGSAETIALAIFIGFCLWLLWRLVILPARRRDSSTIVDDRLLVLRVAPRMGPLAAESARSQTRADAWPTARAWWRTGLGWIRGIAGRVLRTVGVVLVLLFLVGPIVWVALASVQSDVFLDKSPPAIGPFIFGDYVDLVTAPDWQAAALVSIVVTTGATLLSVALAALTAYPLARFRFRGSDGLLAALLGSQLIPPIALAIPVLYVFIRLNLRNTVAGMIIINTAYWTPILVYLVRAAFQSVPPNLDRAARIDGASRIGVIFRVMLPVAAPLIAASAAIVFVGIWNDFVFAAVIGGRDTYTLPRFLGVSISPSLHYLAVRIVLTVAPCVVILALFRRRLFALL